MKWDGMGQNRIEQNRTKYHIVKKLRGTAIKEGRSGTQSYTF